MRGSCNRMRTVRAKEQSLPVIKPLLNFLSNDYWKPVIEPVCPEEIEMINERMKDYEKNPSKLLSISATPENSQTFYMRRLRIKIKK